MKRYSSLLVCTIVACLAAPAAGVAQESVSYAERMSARHELQLAKMELRHYWQVEYPRQRRALNAAIDLTEAEIRDYRTRLKAYGPFDRFSTGQPFLITIQELRMCLREAELRLRGLWAERNALVRFHSEQWRILEMNVHEARLRVAELERDLEESEPITESPPRVATSN